MPWFRNSCVIDDLSHAGSARQLIRPWLQWCLVLIWLPSQVLAASPPESAPDAASVVGSTSGIEPAAAGLAATAELTELTAVHTEGWTLPAHPSEVITWQLLSAVIYAHELLVITLQLEGSGGFYLYQDRVEFQPPAGAVLSQIIAPPTFKLDDPVTAMVVDVYKEGQFTLILQLDPDVPFAARALELAITYLGCSEQLCLLPYTETLPLKVAQVPYAYESDSSSSATASELAPLAASPTAAVAEPESLDHRLARQLTEPGSSPWWLLVLCLLGGLLTNLTPCVYPMIPITLRALGHSGAHPWRESLSYASGIFSMYTLLGVIAVLSGSVLGATSASGWLNLSLAIFLMWMSVSMLGYGRFGMLQRLGHRLGAGSGGAPRTFLMGLSAGFVAAPCTGPILAGLMSYALTQLSLMGSLMAFSTYSLGFAAPYLVVGSVLGSITSIKVSPTLVKLVKMIMAALILGLGLYYVRIPLYEFMQVVPAERWLVMTWLFGGVGLAMAIVAVRCSAITARPIYELAPTLMLGLSLFALTQHLGYQAQSELNWEHDPYEMDVDELTSTLRGATMVALWAEWCTACKVMEATTFSDPQVQQYFARQNIRLVKYDVTTLNATHKYILATLGVRGLPAYVLLDPASGSLRQRQLQGLYEPAHFLNEMQNFFTQGEAGGDSGSG